MSDVSRLQERMIELLSKLERFDADLNDDFLALSAAWDRLDAAWDGVAYQEFTGSWQRTQEMFWRYSGVASKYEDFLRGRIAALNRFERGGGVF